MHRRSGRHREGVGDATWDCIIVGGGAAGLSAALGLGRARRRVLLFDAGGQSNLRADHIGGVLGQDGRPAPDFYARGHEELARYPSVEVRAATVDAISGDIDAGFAVMGELTTHTARRIVLAMGADYCLPEIPGLAERFGRSVFHCPFCHGWDHRGGQLAVLDGSPHGMDRALMLRAWSDDVTLLANGASVASADGARLAAAGVGVDERRIVGLEGPGDALERVVLADGVARPCTGLLIGVELRVRGSFADDLGLARSTEGPFAGQTLAAGAMGETNVPGVFAAGDACTMGPSVAAAMSTGGAAAAGVLHSLFVSP